MIGAVVAAYLLGGVPTADWIAALRGIDLRASGSGNPGANNARRVGGPSLGIMVLLVEVAKGVAAVAAARSIDPSFAVPAAIAAVAGNVLNPFRRFSGGQGLGITLGVLIATWPTIVPIVLAVMGAIALILRRAPAAAITAVAVIIGAAFVWDARQLPVGWGIDSGRLLVLALGLGAVVLPKQLRKSMSDRRVR